MPVHGRLSATAFAALGEVAHAPSDLAFDTIKVAGGVGVRWRLTDEGANIRLDVAVGPAGPELYVLLLEAFLIGRGRTLADCSAAARSPRATAPPRVVERTRIPRPGEPR